MNDVGPPDSSWTVLHDAYASLLRRDVGALLDCCELESLKRYREAQVRALSDMQRAASRGDFDRDWLAQILAQLRVGDADELVNLSLLDIVRGTLASLPAAAFDCLVEIVGIDERSVDEADALVRLTWSWNSREAHVRLRREGSKWVVRAQPLAPGLLPGFEGIVRVWDANG